jgi:hypothetical protein
MVSAGVRDKITTLNDLKDRLGIVQTQANDFFTEWMQPLPALTVSEQQSVDRLKQRYDYQRQDGLLLESTINLVVTSPLLELLGFIDPPFHVKSPYGISLAYMAANPDRHSLNYGMVTNGDEFVFLKLSASGEYDLSRSFSLFPRNHELGHVAQVLKALGQKVLSAEN